MSTVIKFPSRAEQKRGASGHAKQPAGVINLAAERAQRAEDVAAASEVRELRWLSPFQQGLIEAAFSGPTAAAEYLLKRAHINPTKLQGNGRDWRLLWTTDGEMDFFRYIEKAGLHEAAKLLLKRADEQAKKDTRKVDLILQELNRTTHGALTGVIMERNSAAEKAKPAREKGRRGSTCNSSGGDL